jgi:hypothetical protein
MDRLMTDSMAGAYSINDLLFANGSLVLVGVEMCPHNILNVLISTAARGTRSCSSF